MKLIFASLLLLLLTSCAQYEYNTEITPCKNLEGKYKLFWDVSFTGTTDPYIIGKDVYLENSQGNKVIYTDVCDFSYTRNKIIH